MTLRFHFHAQASLKDLTNFPRACSPLVFELTLLTASVNRAVRLLDHHQVAGLSWNSGGWSSDFCVAAHRNLTVFPRLFLRAWLSSRSICWRCSAAVSVPPLCSESSIRGTSMPRVIRGLWLKRARKGTYKLGETSPVACVLSDTLVTRSHPSALAQRNSIPIADPECDNQISRRFLRLGGGLLLVTECQLSTIGEYLG